MKVSPDGRFLTVSIRRLDPEGKGRKLANTYQRVGEGGSEDPFVGTWDRNPIRTIGNSPSRVAFGTFGADGLHFAGNSTEYSALADGKDYKVMGTIVADSVCLKRIDSRTLEELWKDSGQVGATVRRVVSADDLEMTVTVTGTTPQGDHFENVFVYQRAPHPLN